MSIKKSHFPTHAGAITLLVVVSAAASAVEVPKWSTYDITLTASGSSANWYADPNGSVSAAFTGPGGVTQTVRGFWDGGETFKVRFTPEVEGEWTYTTRSQNSGLNGQRGKIAATAALPGCHGFLRIDPHHKDSFVWDDGARYFMEGQTYYDWMYAASVNDNWKTSVDSMLQYGFTKVRFEVYANNLGDEHNEYPDIQPYVDTSKAHRSPDRDSLNIAYWRKLDEMVAYMSAKGMVADLIVTNPYRGNRQYGPAEQNDRFVNYVVARYAAYPNVIWCMSNEWEVSAFAKSAGTNQQHKADYDRMGWLVRNGDPWMSRGQAVRPLSIHNVGIDFAFFDSWATYAVIQHHPNTPTPDAAGNEGIVRNQGRGMPVANDEFGYPGWTNPPLKWLQYDVTRPRHRRAMWGIAAAGGYSSTADFREHPNGMGIPESTGDWTCQPEYDDVKHMVDFFTTKGIEYWKMTSHNELKLAGDRTYVLAEAGRQYVAYVAVGGTIKLNLAPGSYHACLYNPRTGETTDWGTVSGGVQAFTMPTGTEDWVLHLSTFM